MLLSGGLDSAVVLYWALSKGHKVETITFDYFLRSPREIESCKKIARRAQVNATKINLDFLKEIEDSRLETRNPLLKKAPNAYIPSRNLIFYAIASSFAEIVGAKYIVGGHNKDDVRYFPDSSINFFRLFNKTAASGKISKGLTGKVILPLSTLSKVEVVSLGNRLGVPYELTWTCYYSGKKPCRKCQACILRKCAFQKAGVVDPLMAET